MEKSILEMQIERCISEIKKSAKFDNYNFDYKDKNGLRIFVFNCEQKRERYSANIYRYFLLKDYSNEILFSDGNVIDWEFQKNISDSESIIFTHFQNILEKLK